MHRYVSLVGLFEMRRNSTLNVENVEIERREKVLCTLTEYTMCLA